MYKKSLTPKSQGKIDFFIYAPDRRNPAADAKSFNIMRYLFKFKWDHIEKYQFYLFKRACEKKSFSFAGNRCKKG
ncbi:MAG TPA: hypothetical protein DCX19_00045 [Alphaproteobacteria bacterium]|nr:hypothetical protein [Alphaproteobacteria bacterium]